MKCFFNYAILLVTVGILFVGCEKVEYFKSEKGIEKELSGYWKRVRISSADPQKEIWNFNDGTLSITADSVLSMKGTYSIKTKLFKVFITIESLSGSCQNGKWQVIRLDDDVLDMVNDGCAGLIEKEFTKQN